MRWNEVFTTLSKKNKNGIDHKRTLAYYLAALPGYVVSRDELYELLYSGDRYNGNKLPNEKILDVFIFQLRRMLRPEWSITTIRSKGFLLERTERAKRYLCASEGTKDKVHATSNCKVARGVSTTSSCGYFAKSDER